MRARVRWFVVALAAVAVAAGLALPAVVTAMLLALTFAWAPGALVARVVAPETGRARHALLALVVSPSLVGALAAVALGLGATPVTAARIVAYTIAVLSLVAAAWPPREPAEDDGLVPWLAAFGWTAFVMTLVLGNPHLLPRSDGWFHAAVTLQIAQRGLPVEDPFFAGLRLLYFWGVHVWASCWLALAPRLSVWTPYVVLDLVACVAVMLGVTTLARRLGASSRVQAGAAALAAFGYAPFLWLWMLAHVVIGRSTGMAEVRQLLLRGVEPVLASMNPGFLHSSMGFFGDKFLIATPFGLGLALTLAATLALLDAIERPSWRGWIQVAVVQLAALFLHSVVGWADAIVALGWWGWAALRAWRDRDPVARRTLVPLALAFLVPTLVLLPYLRATTAGKQQSFHFGLDVPTVLTWLVAGLAFVPAGMTWLLARTPSNPTRRELAILLVTLTLAALFLGLPLGNQSKLFNLLFVLLAAPAAAGYAAWMRRAPRLRPWLVTALVAGIVPTTLLFTWGFATERGQLNSGWDVADRADERAVWTWLASHTPPDAIVVDADARLDMTVRGARSALWGGDGWAKNWGYDPSALAARRAAAATLGAGRPATPTVRTLLDGLGREVVVVARRGDPQAPGAAWSRLVAPADPPPGFTLLDRQGDVALFRWDGR